MIRCGTVLSPSLITFTGEAEPLYRRALRIWDEQMGPAHPESAYPLSGLAHLYARQGKYAEAEPLYQRALRIWEAQVGETHLLTGETRRALAELQEAQGHHEEARSGFERGVHRSWEQRLPLHPRHASISSPCSER